MSSQPVTATIEVDALGNGDFRPYRKLRVSKEGYANFVFPDGFSAHWVQLRPSRDAKLSAQFFYN